MDVGITFSPAQQPFGGAPSQGPRPGVTPLQDAIKLLSFRLPTNVGAGAPSPAQIMGGPTALGAQFGNGVANNWLMALFRGLNPAAVPGAAFAPSAPTGAAPAFSDMTAPRVAVQYAQPPFPGTLAPPHTWGGAGGAARTIGPARITPLDLPGSGSLPGGYDPIAQGPFPQPPGGWSVQNLGTEPR